MKLPIAWLRDYLDTTLSTDEIAARFATLGFPVDHIERRSRLEVFVEPRAAERQAAERAALEAAEQGDEADEGDDEDRKDKKKKHKHNRQRRRRHRC